MKKKCYLILIIFLALLLVLNYQNIKYSFEKMITNENKANEIIDDDSEIDAENNKLDTFELSEFQWEIENASFQKKYEKVENEEQVIALALKIWEQEYHSEYSKEPFRLEDLEKIIVEYDDKSDCWFVSGVWQTTFSEDVPFIIGGEPGLLIKSNGETIAMWINN